MLGKSMNQAVNTNWAIESGGGKLSALPPESLTNVDLILLCQQKTRPDSTAFNELLRRYQSHVDKILYHLAPDWQDRADLAQEVWIRVYRNIHRLNEPSNLRVGSAALPLTSSTTSYASANGLVIPFPLTLPGAWMTAKLTGTLNLITPVPMKLYPLLNFMNVCVRPLRTYLKLSAPPLSCGKLTV